MGAPETLPTSTAAAAAAPKPASRRWARLGALVLALGAAPFLLSPPGFLSLSAPAAALTPAQLDAALKAAACEQPDAVLPQGLNASAVVEGEKDQIVTWLSDAVKVPTEIFDVMGPVGDDPRWDVFYKWSEYLEKAFPLVHQHLTRTRVQEHALIFEWQGSDASLKPLLLMGHSDVVPVLPATRGLWTHDPYGGEYDGEKIWGRGSTDDKSGTVGALASVELLLRQGTFQPTRTLILSFGSDEETGGKVGAKNLAAWILEKYGPDSMAMIVDEGSGISQVFGDWFGLPAVGEKGYLDVEVKVETLGGHSSIPPPHTGIGLISLLLAEIERTPHKPVLKAESPLVGLVSCAANAAGAPKDLRALINKLNKSIEKGRPDKDILKRLRDWWVTGSAEQGVLPPGMGKALVSTTQAVDIINGGVKVNALPEVVTAYVNHRIDISSSVAELQKRLIHTLGPLAEQYGLDFEAFGEAVDTSVFARDEACHGRRADHAKHGKHGKPKHAGKLTIGEAFNSSLDPAPVSPYTVDSSAWRLLAGTSRGVFATRPESYRSAEEAAKELQFAPFLSTGNTDTKHYWALSKNIYRFAYMFIGASGMNNIHTVDEFNDADSFVEQVRWFANFIVNVDESREI
ncbi:hypothetical protein Q8F55_007507 [Vanrija albida]|uniref:Peptidase M20 dimerisation domain-containing protein n=1 Tax=Vanrija albida TaxID=181172 RepID=A0ABR3PTS8_9TREE